MSSKVYGTKTDSKSLVGCCDKPAVKDLSQKSGPNRHLYCETCKSHLWKGRQYTGKEWYEWINS